MFVYVSVSLRLFAYGCVCSCMFACVVAGLRVVVHDCVCFGLSVFV